MDRRGGKAYAATIWPQALQLVEDEMDVFEDQARDFLDSHYGEECAAEILQRLHPGYVDPGRWSNFKSCLKHFGEEWNPERLAAYSDCRSHQPDKQKGGSASFSSS